ncbi:hypothetical protein LCGC14_1230340 [marine sediment metagenome]|uniref:Uncharacterized protein n=1 Tax=marine sediment metagenome TaxID=412755 RepID=A0A0F9L8R7_9ZZZZ
MDVDVSELIGKARAWMNEGQGKWVCLGAGGVLILLACLIFLSGSGGTEAGEILDRGLLAKYLCTKCKASGEVRVRFSPGDGVNFASKFPIDCPKCGAPDSAVLAIKCTACKKPMAASDEPIYKCPHCKKVYDNTIRPG